MSIKTQKTTIYAQDSITNLSQNPKTTQFIQLYRIKVQDLKKNMTEKNTQRNIYLTIKFDDQNQTVIQTQCIELLNANKYFEIKTLSNITRIEVLDYDNMKKLSKINLKGINKEFKYTHSQEKNQIQILIQRSHVNLELFRQKSKMTQSIIIENFCDEEKQCESTDDSSSEFSN